jgi:DNA-binding response OmpR family regulator
MLSQQDEKAECSLRWVGCPMTSSNDDHSPGAGSSDDLNGLDILFVEDSRSVGEAVKGLLELLGAQVAGPAATAAEAERLLYKHSPDVALVDFHLRGGELAHGLIARLHDQDVPVIVVSGLGMAELPLVKAAAILQKPFSEAQLLANLRTFIKRNTTR